MATVRKIQFSNPQQSEFYPKLKERVKAYFEEHEISPYANTFMVFKIVFFLSGLVGIYLFLLLGHYSLLVSYVLWIGLGLFTAFVGVNICHDALHGAISPHRKVNVALGYLFNIAGANAYVWDISHNRIHHTYTNIQDFDEDINTTSLIRMSPHQPLKKFHCHQHWYAWLLYCLTTLSWMFIKDYKRFFQKRIGNHIARKPPLSEYLNLFFFKAIYYTLYLILPLVLLEFTWWQTLSGFVLMHLVEGFCLAVIIQMAHMVEATDFPLPDKIGNIDNSWAIHQLRTTADFARSNPWVGFFFGGLNFHIEHHLFQRVCHVHHRAISHIVKRTALEFSVPYHDIPSLWGAMRSHAKFLKKMGRNDHSPQSAAL